MRFARSQALCWNVEHVHLSLAEARQCCVDREDDLRIATWEVQHRQHAALIGDEGPQGVLTSFGQLVPLRSVLLRDPYEARRRSRPGERSVTAITTEPLPADVERWSRRLDRVFVGVAAFGAVLAAVAVVAGLAGARG